MSLAFKQHFNCFKRFLEKANKDFLTGLNNHGYFKEILEKEVAVAKETDQPLSVVILDIDDFKKYNDLNGHIQGDHLLQEFGATFENRIRRGKIYRCSLRWRRVFIIMPNTNRKTLIRS